MFFFFFKHTYVLRVLLCLTSRRYETGWNRLSIRERGANELTRERAAAGERGAETTEGMKFAVKFPEKRKTRTSIRVQGNPTAVVCSTVRRLTQRWRLRPDGKLAGHGTARGHATVVAVHTGGPRRRSVGRSVGRRCTAVARWPRADDRAWRRRAAGLTAGLLCKRNTVGG